jgi:cytochrome P450
MNAALLLPEADHASKDQPTGQGVPRWDDASILTQLFEDDLIAREREAVLGLYDALTRKRPFFRDATGSWVVSSFEQGCAVLSDSAYVARPPLPPEEAAVYAPMLATMLLSDGDAHAALRRHFAPLFKTQRMERLHAFMDEDIARRVAELPDAAFDAGASFVHYLPARAACVLLGLSPAHAPRLVALTAPVLRLISGTPLPPDAMLTLLQASRGAIQALANLMASEAPATLRYLDIDPAALATQALADGTQPASCASNLCLLFVAAYTTSMLSLGNTLALATQRPGVWANLARDPAHTPRVVAELGRLAPAAQALQRYAARDVTLEGVALRAGDPVAVMVAAANRDPRVFDHPDEVDLARGPRTLTFGAGPHGCVGVGLARRQLGGLLAALTRRYPRLAPLQRPSRGLQVGTFLGYDSLWLGVPDRIPSDLGALRPQSA